MKAITIALLTFAASLSFAQDYFKPVTQEQIQPYAMAISLKNSPMNCHAYAIDGKTSKSFPESIKPQDSVPNQVSPYQVNSSDISRSLPGFNELSITEQSLCFRLKADEKTNYVQLTCIWFNAADDITGYAWGKFDSVKFNAGTLREPKIVSGWKLVHVATCKSMISNSNTKTK
jgi:hypothetical protein